MPQSTATNLGLDIFPYSRDANNLFDLHSLYNAVKTLSAALDAYTGIVGAAESEYAVSGTDFLLVQNSSRLYVSFAASVTAGQLIKIDSAGEADLGIAGNVIGWAPAAVTSGDYGEVRLLGLDLAISGLTAGVVYYASASTPGGITASPTIQRIGIALTSQSLFFDPCSLSGTTTTITTQFDSTVTAGQLLRLNNNGHADLGTVLDVIGWAPADVAINDYGEVGLFGMNTAVSGLTPGAFYYPSLTAGALDGAPPIKTVASSTFYVAATSGGAVTTPLVIPATYYAPVGFAIDSNTLFFNPSYKV